MSHALLKHNLESLISQKRYRVSQVEELAGLKQGSLSNILSGRSKKPSAEILLSIANVFGVTVEKLFYKDTVQFAKHMTQDELHLFCNSVIYLGKQIEEQKINIHYQELINIIKEVFEYSAENNEKYIDKKFIDWYLKQNFNLL